MSTTTISPGLHRVDRIPASCILDTWSNHDWANGIQIESLEDLTEIHAATRNSVYEFTVIDPASRAVLVRGGRFFTEKTPAHLAGSSLGKGRGFLKLGGIYVGFSVELVTERGTFITTHIKTIQVFQPSELGR